MFAREILRHRQMSPVPSDQAANGDRMHCGIETGIQAQQGRSEHRGGLANRSSQTTLEGATGYPHNYPHNKRLKSREHTRQPTKPRWKQAA